jgi:DHA2 family multidrug resistance protein-like MFS transporter
VTTATADNHISTSPRAGRRAWLGLAVLALPALLVSMDLFVMLLAVPRIGTALHASSTEQLWILDIYGFMVAGFLITMGNLGDRIGRRRLLLIGAATFGVASVLASYSVSPAMLIGSRALLGVAGATLTPSTLALIMNLFHDPQEQARGIAIWAGSFVAGAIAGPIVGGVLLEHFWWGSVFLLGVPAMVLLLVVGPRLLPEFRNPSAGRLDLTSAALSLLAILPIIYGLKDAARGGFHLRPLAAVAVGLALGVAFVRRQKRLANPLVDLRLFANRAFSVTLGAMLAYSMLSGGTMVYVAQHFQLVHGLSPLRAGLAMVPGMAAAIVGFQLAPGLGRRIRPAVLFSTGLAVAVTGLLLLTRVAPDSGLTLPIVAFVLASLGGAPLVALGTNLVIGSVPMDKAGSAAGVAQTGNELGYALGVAILGSVGTAVYRGGMAKAQITGAAEDTLAGAVATARTLPDQAAAALLDTARHAFAGGFHVAAFVGAAILTAVAVLTATMLRHLPTLGAVTPEGEAGPATVPAER